MIVPIALDVTDAAQIQAAAAALDDLDIVVNNAGLGTYEDLDDRAVLVAHPVVNLFGPYGRTQALLPALTRLQGGS